MRPLRDTEISALRSVFQDHLDYSRIRLGPTLVGRLLMPRFVAVVFGQRIHFRPSYYLEDFTTGPPEKMALLVHECAHCWQAQTHGYWWGKGMAEQIRYGKRVYQFRIEDHEELVDYRWEQQGAIVQRYYHLRAMGSHQTTYYQKVVEASLPPAFSTRVSQSASASAPLR